MVIRTEWIKESPLGDFRWACFTRGLERTNLITPSMGHICDKKDSKNGVLRWLRRTRTYKPYHPLNGGTDVIKKTPKMESLGGRESARAYKPYHPLNGGTDVTKKTPKMES